MSVRLVFSLVKNFILPFVMSKYFRILKSVVHNRKDERVMMRSIAESSGNTLANISKEFNVPNIFSALVTAIHSPNELFKNTYDSYINTPSTYNIIESNIISWCIIVMTTCIVKLIFNSSTQKITEVYVVNGRIYRDSDKSYNSSSFGC